MSCREGTGVKMKTTHRAAMAVLGLAIMAAAAFGQTGEPPQIVGASIYYLPTYGLGSATQGFGDLVGPLTPAEFSDLVLHEADYVSIVIDVMLSGTGGQPTDLSQIKLFYGKYSFPYPIYASPAAPPVDGDTVAHWNPAGDGIVGDFSPATIIGNPAENVYTIEIDFFLPEINGTNQDRLRGLIDYDVSYSVWVWVWNAATAEDTIPPYIFFQSKVIESPYLRPRNDPPAFPDAGADMLAAAGSTVDLDARRTFDSFNLGFDYLDPNVFEKDTLQFTWEWLSGPERVDPVAPGPARAPWLAQVKLDELGTYVYRVFVSDGVNPVPQSDTTTIEVVDTLPVNHAPHAVINGPTEQVVVGQIITLDGSASSDPDGTQLHYRWRQTDEVGEALPFYLLATTFQPMSGLQQPVSEWQALSPGTYYFILLVDDLKLTDSATTSVTVVTAANAGESATQDASAGDSQPAPLAALPAGACGAGLAPLLLAPFALLLLRGRVR
jgi:hypothetical protein